MTAPGSGAYKFQFEKITFSRNLSLNETQKRLRLTLDLDGSCLNRLIGELTQYIGC